MRLFLPLALLFVSGSTCLADLMVSTDDSAPIDSPAVDGFDTAGHQMGGMMVTATFADNSTQTLSWAALPAISPQAGGVTGTGWSLTVDGNTHPAVAGNGPWILSNDSGQALTMLLIEASDGDIAFDLGDVEITPGSDIGHTFSEGTPQGTHTVDDFFNFTEEGDVAAVYSNPVTINGAPLPPTPDLYGTLKLTFSDDPIASGLAFHFDADTDFIGARAIPEPSAFACIGLVFVLGTGVKRLIGKCSDTV